MAHIRMDDNFAPHSRNSLGVQGHVYQKLLEKLNDHRNPTYDTHPSRIHCRKEYMDPYILMVLENEDSMDRPMTLAARNISRGGVGLLHSHYVYPKTRVMVYLTVDGKDPQPVRGIVQRCIHRGGVVHEVGVKFDREINIQQYLRADISECLQSFERVEPEKLTGKVLLVGTNHDFSPMCRSFLQDTSLAYKFVATAEEARAMEIEDYEMLVILNDLDDCEGTEFVSELRERFYTRPIVLVGDIKHDLAMQKVRASGADMLLPWPATSDSMQCAIAEYLMTDWTQETLEALRTCVDKSTTDALRTEMAKLGVMLDQALRTTDPIRVYAISGQIRAMAPLLGMKQLRDLTLKVGEDIAEDGNLEKESELISDIVAMCSSIARAA